MVLLGRVAATATALVRQGPSVHHALRTQLPAVSMVSARAFSGNTQYPRIEGSVTDLTANLTTIGARLSIPTAALYLTRKKIEYIVRNTKTKDELREVQRTLLLCDAKFAYPSEFAISSFISACIKLEAADMALEFMRGARHMRHYMKNQSFVRLASHYAEEGEDAVVDEIVQLMAAAGVAPSTKMYAFRVAHAKKNDDLEKALALAKQAANEQQVNSHLILQLLDGLEGDALAKQLPLAEYLVAKGDVFVNDKLRAVLKKE